MIVELKFAARLMPLKVIDFGSQTPSQQQQTLSHVEQRLAGFAPLRGPSGSGHRHQATPGS
jgi:hypothetical protein